MNFMSLILLMCLMSHSEELTPQEVAQIRANWMVTHHHRWHPPYRVGRVFKHARFEGVGWAKSHRSWKTIGTCRPRRRMKLIADAYAKNRRMAVRVQLWR